MQRITDMFMRFKGVRNDDVGARLVAMPVRQQTAIRGSKQTLPGRDGFLLLSTGYQEITVKQDLIVPESADMAAVKNWLSGSGELIFGDFPNYAYDAMVITPLSLSSPSARLTGQRISVTFTCQPFMHLVQEEDIVLTEGDVFNGQGDVNSLPLVVVEGSGSQILTINGRAMHLTLAEDVPLYVDCDAGTAYTMDGDTLEFAGEQVTVVDDWYELHPYSEDIADHNAVSFTSGITQVTITPRWRWF